MHTLRTFISEWQKCHHPSMDLGDDVAFYHDVYRQLRGIVEKCAKRPDDDIIIRLVMLVENSASIGMDGAYEYMYRCIDDQVWHLCNLLNVNKAYQQIYSLISDSVSKAPVSSLRHWMVEGIRSRDFLRLKNVAHFLAFQDKTLLSVYPSFQFREKVYTDLAKGDKETARKMVESDMEFNWRDKEGLTILQRLAGFFQRRKGEEDVAEILRSVCPIRMEAYLPMQVGCNQTLALVDRHGEVFEYVPFSDSLPEGYQDKCLIAQLVGYGGCYHVNGPGLWCEKQAFALWDGNRIWQGIERDEKEYAKTRTFITPFGKEISLYDDLYTTSQASEEFGYAGLGIYLDEPNLLTFLDWLQPEFVDS